MKDWSHSNLRTPALVIAALCLLASGYFIWSVLRINTNIAMYFNPPEDAVQVVGLMNRKTKKSDDSSEIYYFYLSYPDPDRRELKRKTRIHSETLYGAYAEGKAIYIRYRKKSPTKIIVPADNVAPGFLNRKKQMLFIYAGAAGLGFIFLLILSFYLPTGKLRHPPFKGIRLEQIREIKSHLDEIAPSPLRGWEAAFRRKLHPDAELKKWLRLARCYSTYSEKWTHNPQACIEIYDLLHACMTKGEQKAMNSIGEKIKIIPPDEAQSIVSCYLSRMEV